MPYKSRAQAAYFNIHRKEMESQGVNVDEWNSASKGMKLPKHKNKGGAIAVALSNARKFRKGMDAGGDVPPIRIIPPGVSGLKGKAKTDWRRQTTLPGGEGPGSTATGSPMLEEERTVPWGRRASGGSALQSLALKGSSIKLGREGMINSAVPGRTDKLPMNLKAGSYILPADIPSALGQGNSMAGGEILKKMFSSGPYGLPAMRGRSGRAPVGRLNLSPQKIPKQKFQEGGEAEGDDHVPIIAAGGEYILSPETVEHHPLAGAGKGLKHGHDTLDKFVVKVRKKYAETLKKLPGPKK